MNRISPIECRSKHLINVLFWFLFQCKHRRESPRGRLALLLSPSATKINNHRWPLIFQCLSVYLRPRRLACVLTLEMSCFHIHFRCFRWASLPRLFRLQRKVLLDWTTEALNPVSSCCNIVTQNIRWSRMIMHDCPPLFWLVVIISITALRVRIELTSPSTSNLRLYHWATEAFVNSILKT